MQRTRHVMIAAAVVAAATSLAAPSAHAVRGRFSVLDVVGVGGAAVFGPTYRQRTWSGTPYFQFYEPRFYGSYPSNRYLVPNARWGRTRW